MVMDNVILDFDDFAFQPERNCLKELLWLKNKWPNLKVTLFAIPYYENKSQELFFTEVVSKHRDWIQLGVHGLTHHSNFECMKWSWKEAQAALEKAEKMCVFEKLFKAPGWQISRDTYVVLKNKDYICADHTHSAYTENGVPNSERRPKHLKVYEVGHPWMVHGHTWNCEGNVLPELIEKWEKEGYPWNEDSKFHWIADVV